MAGIHNYTESKLTTGIKGESHGQKNEFEFSGRRVKAVVVWLRLTLTKVFLPDGYPGSVAPGYLPYLLLSNSATFFTRLQGAIDEYAFLKGVGFGDKVV